MSSGWMHTNLVSKSFKDFFSRLKQNFRTWLTGSQLDKAKGIRHNPHWKRHLFKRIISGAILLGVIALAIVASIGFYNSFQSGLAKMFKGTADTAAFLVKLSAHSFAVFSSSLAISGVSRFKMAVIMMVRGYWATVRGVAWTYRYLSVKINLFARARYAFGKWLGWGGVQEKWNTNQQALWQEKQGYRDLGQDFVWNIMMVPLSTINAVINLTWVDAHGMSPELMDYGSICAKCIVDF